MEKNEPMDRHGVFWINLWRTAGAVFVIFVITVSVYNYADNVLRHESWQKCVEVGGQPINQPMMGKESTTFTCIRK